MSERRPGRVVGETGELGGVGMVLVIGEEGEVRLVVVTEMGR